MRGGLLLMKKKEARATGHEGHEARGTRHEGHEARGTRHEGRGARGTRDEGRGTRDGARGARGTRHVRDPPASYSIDALGGARSVGPRSRHYAEHTRDLARPQRRAGKGGHSVLLTTTYLLAPPHTRTLVECAHFRGVGRTTLEAPTAELGNSASEAASNTNPKPPPTLEERCEALEAENAKLRTTLHSKRASGPRLSKPKGSRDEQSRSACPQQDTCPAHVIHIGNRKVLRPLSH